MQASISTLMNTQPSPGSDLTVPAMVRGARLEAQTAASQPWPLLVVWYHWAEKMIFHDELQHPCSYPPPPPTSRLACSLSSRLLSARGSGFGAVQGWAQGCLADHLLLMLPGVCGWALAVRLWSASAHLTRLEHKVIKSKSASRWLSAQFTHFVQP